MKHSATIMHGYWFPFHSLLSLLFLTIAHLLGHTPFELLFLLLVIFFCGWDVGIKLRISESLKTVYSHAGPVTESSDVQVRTGADSCIAGFLFLMLHLSWIPSQIHLQNCCIKIFPELKEVRNHSVKMVSYSVNSAPKVDTAELILVCSLLFFDFYGFLSWGWVFLKLCMPSLCSSFVCVLVCFLVLLWVSLRQHCGLLETTDTLNKVSLHWPCHAYKPQRISSSSYSECFLLCAPRAALLMFWALMMERAGRRISSAGYSYFQTCHPATLKLGFCVCEMGLITPSHRPITGMTQANKGFRTPSSWQNLSQC